MAHEQVEQYLAYSFPSNQIHRYLSPQIDKRGISCKYLSPHLFFISFIF